jgi:acyl-CoA thioesterase FadM
VYVTYIEVARQEYWKRLTGARDYGSVPFILAHVTIDFRAEALMDEVLLLGIRCEWVGEKSFAFAYQIRTEADDRLVVEATSIQVCYDYRRNAASRCPRSCGARPRRSRAGRSRAASRERERNEARPAASLAHRPRSRGGRCREIATQVPEARGADLRGSARSSHVPANARRDGAEEVRAGGGCPSGGARERDQEAEERDGSSAEGDSRLRAAARQ